MEYSVQDDVAPMSTRESWDFIRRSPTFYAYNPNDKTKTNIDYKDRVRSKLTDYAIDNAVVVFKDIGYRLYQDEDKK